MLSALTVGLFLLPFELQVVTLQRYVEKWHSSAQRQSCPRDNQSLAWAFIYIDYSAAISRSWLLTNLENYACTGA